MELAFSYEIFFTLITLTFLEIVLGIDNIIFIALVVASLPNHYRDKARYFGIGLALIIRIIMLTTLSWVMGLTDPLFYINQLPFSVNNILLIVGGIFLIFKSAKELKESVFGSSHEHHEHDEKKVKTKGTFTSAVFQIALVDFVFSFDSIITAIAMTRDVSTIIIAVVISMSVMLFSADYVSKVINRYPSIKIMALAFIFMVGVILLADGFHFYVSKVYLYFALFFASGIEALNILASKKNKNFTRN